MNRTNTFRRLATAVIVLMATVALTLSLAPRSQADFASITLDGVRDAGYNAAIATDPSGDLANPAGRAPAGAT